MREGPFKKRSKEIWVMVLPFLNLGPLWGVMGNPEVVDLAITGDKLGGDKLSPENKKIIEIGDKFSPKTYANGEQ
jgi:hypothetical protein